MNEPVRWLQRLSHFGDANARLHSACAQPEYSDIELAGLVQTFEFTFELAWKTLKDLFAYQGIEIDNPRETFKQAFREGLLADQLEEWLGALTNRNRLAHTIIGCGYRAVRVGADARRRSAHSLGH